MALHHLRLASPLEALQALRPAGLVSTGPLGDGPPPDEQAELDRPTQRDSASSVTDQLPQSIVEDAILDAKSTQMRSNVVCLCPVGPCDGLQVLQGLPSC